MRRAEKPSFSQDLLFPLAFVLLATALTLAAQAQALPIPQEKEPDFLTIMAINNAEMEKTYQQGHLPEPLTVEKANKRLLATIRGLENDDFSSLPDDVQAFLSRERAKLRAIIEYTKKEVVASGQASGAMFALHLARNMLRSFQDPDKSRALDASIVWSAQRFLQALEAEGGRRPR